MNKDCNVVRDLMPLCIDGAASEESQQMVTEHVAACGECAEVFREMQTELSVSDASVEDKTLDEAARKINKRRIRRMLITGVIGMVMGIVIFLVAANIDEIVFRAKYVRLNGDLRFEAVYMTVYKQDGGVWSIKSNSVPSGNPHFSNDVNICYTEDGKGAYLQFRSIYKGWETEDYSSAYTGTWGKCLDEVWSVPNYDSEAQEDVPVLWVERLSGNESKIIWRQGDETMTQDELYQVLQSMGYYK